MGSLKKCHIFHEGCPKLISQWGNLLGLLTTSAALDTALAGSNRNPRMLAIEEACTENTALTPPGQWFCIQIGISLSRRQRKPAPKTPLCHRQEKWFCIQTGINIARPFGDVSLILHPDGHQRQPFWGCVTVSEFRWASVSPGPVRKCH